jgi:7 transmembrane receptor (rhodopsin family)
MIVPIEAAHTSAINYAALAIGQSNLTAMNLTTDELCTQLKANLTEMQQSQFDWASYGCTKLEHAPHLTDKVILKVIVLSIMGILSLVGNMATIWNIQKNRTSRRALRHSCSAIYALIVHLSVADILVTFFCIIGEALWSYTVEWLAGDIACKLVKIFQMFALYLSTNVLVLIGIDRWVAVKYPMKSKSLNTSRFLVRSRKRTVTSVINPNFLSSTGFSVRYISGAVPTPGEWITTS